MDLSCFPRHVIVINAAHIALGLAALHTVASALRRKPMPTWIGVVILWALAILEIAISYYVARNQQIGEEIYAAFWEQIHCINFFELLIPVFFTLLTIAILKIRKLHS